MRYLLVLAAALVFIPSALASTWVSEGSATAAAGVTAKYSSTEILHPLQLRVRVTGPSDTNGYAQALCLFTDGEEIRGAKEWFGTPSFYPIPIPTDSTGTLVGCWTYAQSISSLGLHGVEIQALL